MGHSEAVHLRVYRQDDMCHDVVKMSKFLQGALGETDETLDRGLVAVKYASIGLTSSEKEEMEAARLKELKNKKRGKNATIYKYQNNINCFLFYCE